MGSERLAVEVRARILIGREHKGVAKAKKYVGGSLEKSMSRESQGRNEFEVYQRSQCDVSL